MTQTNERLTRSYIEREERWISPNYHPLEVVIERGEGIHVWDVEGRRYIDCLSAYSAISHGHRHPRIIAETKAQLDTLTLTSRAFYNNRLGEFMETLCEFAGYEMACPMNTGAEAVETAIKVARRWGYRHKKVAQNQAEIIVCEHNFHGRTTTIVGFSSDPESYGDFGPPTPGFVKIPFGDMDALKQAITPDTVAFLVEPIQGEAGVIVPPAGYLKSAFDICQANQVLMIADEIQTGLGRTGKKFCYEYDDIKPDLVTLGKSLGGGVLPVSAVLGSREVMGVLTHGSHGSTFGGNPLASRVAVAALRVIQEEKLVERSAELGAYFKARLETLPRDIIIEVRGRGLLLAIEINKKAGTAEAFVHRMKDRGLLAKQTHDTTIRLAPPLIITREEIDEAFAIIQAAVLSAAK